MTENWQARNVISYAERSLVNIMRERSSGVVFRNRSSSSMYSTFFPSGFSRARAEGAVSQALRP